MSLVYLAAPYTHKDPAVVAERMQKFCNFDSALGAAGIITVSPLLKHLLFIHGSELPRDWAFWENYSKTLLSKCDCLVVMRMDGVEESTGVMGEIAFARAHSIEIVNVNAIGFLEEPEKTALWIKSLLEINAKRK